MVNNTIELLGDTVNTIKLVTGSNIFFTEIAKNTYRIDGPSLKNVMLKSQYDKNNQGVVDQAKSVNGKRLEVDVTKAARLTDTVPEVGNGGLTEINFTKRIYNVLLTCSEQIKEYKEHIDKLEHPKHPKIEDVEMLRETFSKKFGLMQSILRKELEKIHKHIVSFTKATKQQDVKIQDVVSKQQKRNVKVDELINIIKVSTQVFDESVGELVENIENIKTSLDKKQDIVFEKSAFNKNFGKGKTDVARGDHKHVFPKHDYSKTYAPINHQHQNLANAKHGHPDLAKEKHKHTDYAKTFHTHDYSLPNHGHVNMWKRIDSLEKKVKLLTKELNKAN